MFRKIDKLIGSCIEFIELHTHSENMHIKIGDNRRRKFYRIVIQCDECNKGTKLKYSYYNIQFPRMSLEDMLGVHKIAIRNIDTFSRFKNEILTGIEEYFKEKSLNVSDSETIHERN
jgi:hypothetical protein